MHMDEFETPRPMSAAAVTSLVFGLLLCIPGAGLFGAVFGAVGLMSTGGETGRRGRGVAVSGLIFSLVGIVGWGAAAYAVKQVWDTTVAPTMKVVFSGPDQVLTAAFAGDQTAFEADWMPGTAPDEATRQAFVDGVTATLGAFQSAEIVDDGQGPPPEAMGPGGDAFDLPFTVVFAEGTVEAAVSFRPSQKGEVTPSGSYVGVSRIEFTAPDGGVFTLGHAEKASGDASTDATSGDDESSEGNDGA